MIPRYSLPEMSAIWSEQHKLAVWKEVETLAVEAWAEQGIAPVAAVTAMRAAPEVDPAMWKERENATNHDLAAFVDVLTASLKEGGEWVHYGLTSSDVIDTAQGAILKEAAELLITRVHALFDIVKERSFEHNTTVMIGRTHGIWAEPTTFGLKLATWAFELARNHERLLQARDIVAVGKISGAVGTYAHLPPSLEAFVCARLKLQIEQASSQVVHRDRHAEFLSTLALAGSSLERFATEIRHLQRSEVREVSEAFGRDQKGSSAMPHKRNPIVAENTTGISRLLRAYASAGLENVALWHERDITHSSVERVTLPDACLALDYALVRMTRLITDMQVDERRMKESLTHTHGVIFSQAVLLALIEDGMCREDAYRTVQRNATSAWEAEQPLLDLLVADPEITLTKAKLADCFDPQRFLHNAQIIFDRLEGLELRNA